MSVASVQSQLRTVPSKRITGVSGQYARYTCQNDRLRLWSHETEEVQDARLVKLCDYALFCLYLASARSLWAEALMDVSWFYGNALEGMRMDIELIPQLDAGSDASLPAIWFNF